jgi:hypothetical protein
MKLAIALLLVALSLSGCALLFAPSMIECKVKPAACVSF